MLWTPARGKRLLASLHCPRGLIFRRTATEEPKGASSYLNNIDFLLEIFYYIGLEFEKFRT